MPAPNNTYDPVRVAALAPAEVERMTGEGLAAIGAAATFDDLKEAEVAHRGRQAPLTLASAEIGALPPEARAEAGRRVGNAKKRLDDALAARHADLEADQDRRVLEEPTVRFSTCASRSTGPRSRSSGPRSGPVPRPRASMRRCFSSFPSRATPAPSTPSPCSRRSPRTGPGRGSAGAASA